jgi:hypothetical protein
VDRHKKRPDNVSVGGGYICTGRYCVLIVMQCFKIKSFKSTVDKSAAYSNYKWT